MKFSRARILQLVVDGVIIVLALAVAYAVRFEGLPPKFYLKQFLLVAPYLVLLRLAVLIAFGTYRLVWRYIGLRDLPRIAAAMLLTSLLVATGRLLAPTFVDLFGLRLNASFAFVPFSVLLAELVFSAVGLVGARVLWRVLIEHGQQSRVAARRSGKSKALLIGAGQAGVMVAKEVASNPDVGFEIAGFLDDDRAKQQTIIHGHRVVGSIAEMALHAEQLEATVAVITIASASSAEIRRIVERAEESGLQVKIIPGLYEILSGSVSISKVRDVALEDLLGREPVRLEESAVGAFISGKVVMVTGGGGSIGSEICRQVARFAPSKLIVLDQAENPVFHLCNELGLKGFGFPLVPRIASITDRARLGQVMAQDAPQVVFHAAAHKHVPLMEANPSEAIRNNIQGTLNVAELSREYAVEAFVMISTDKAVNPTSVMGASKRVAEMLVQSLSAPDSTRFLTVRFGNVLGSQGSVVPLFKQQIARGGPVTVTHPEMKRYFMTIPEASQLVLQAAAMGEGGEIFILEMGEPVKIVNLARDLIRLSGYKPDEEIRLEFTGMRPGEKLYEEINLSEENATKTKHPRIWVGSHKPVNSAWLRARIEELSALVGTDDEQGLRRALRHCVPEFVLNCEPGLTVAESAPNTPLSHDFVGPTSVQPTS